MPKISKKIVKVCGMRDAENIREVEQLNTELSIVNSQFSIDMMGFIFWPKSSRYVSERPAYLPTKCRRVGVFVNADIDDVRRTAADYALDFIQLHGSESPDYIRTLRADSGIDTSVDGGFATVIIKAFNIATAADLEATKPYEGLVDYFLFDTKGKSVGGNGEKFDWTVLADYVGETPFLLSGGIGPDDAERVRALISGRACSRSSEQTSSICSRSIAAFSHPLCIGIDLNSRFETAPAMKDVAALRRFLSQLSH